ncbi:hypothetical protein [Natronoarchaeum rubrum]|uniref:hypothetical protein n=1 Tax=Natronoarchaeum rubrum TaxID=755311 RepID=UPI0021120749|nr:hypothetical protein [Natronoarchaeum rubrum]
MSPNSIHESMHEISGYEKRIRDEHGHQPSVDDQVALFPFLVWLELTNRDNALTVGPIREHVEEYGIDLNHNVNTTLGNLHDLGLLARYYPDAGNDAIIVSERLDDVVFESWEEVTLRDQQALIEHIHEQEEQLTAWADGGVVPLRRILAVEFDVPPEEVEDHLHTGTIDEQREKLNEAINVVEAHEEVDSRDSYGRVEWLHKGYRYWVPSEVLSGGVVEG